MQAHSPVAHAGKRAKRFKTIQHRRTAVAIATQGFSQQALIERVELGPVEPRHLVGPRGQLDPVAQLGLKRTCLIARQHAVAVAVGLGVELAQGLGERGSVLARGVFAARRRGPGAAD